MDEQLKHTLAHIRKVAHLEATVKLMEGEVESMSNKEHWFHYITPKEFENRILLRKFYEQYDVKRIAGCDHNSLNTKDHEKYHEVCMHIIETMMDPSVWTTGADCAWISGEYNGYYYNIYLMGNRKIRYTTHKINCGC